MFWRTVKGGVIFRCRVGLCWSQASRVFRVLRGKSSEGIVVNERWRPAGARALARRVLWWKASVPEWFVVRNGNGGSRLGREEVNFVKCHFAEATGCSFPTGIFAIYTPRVTPSVQYLCENLFHTFPREKKSSVSLLGYFAVVYCMWHFFIRLSPHWEFWNVIWV